MIPMMPHTSGAAINSKPMAYSKKAGICDACGGTKARRGRFCPACRNGMKLFVVEHHLRDAAKWAAIHHEEKHPANPRWNDTRKRNQ